MLVKERLDRALVTEELRFLIPEVSVFHLPRLFADHYPIFINLLGGHNKILQRPFRFKAIWTAHPGLEPLIRDQGTGHKSLSTTLSNFVGSLQQWNNQLEDRLQHEYLQILRLEELFWYQKYRVRWMDYGDRNSWFYHLLTLNPRKNKIESLKIAPHEWINDLEALEAHALSYFCDLIWAPTATPAVLRRQSFGPHATRRILGNLESNLNYGRF